jgi:predicted nucleotidyltransferase
LILPNLGSIAPKMGRKTGREGGLARALFSQVQLRLLGILFGNPDANFHASELIRMAGSGSGAVQRELERLGGAGILVVNRSGNRKLYRANRDSPIFSELQQIILKTEGLVEPLRRALRGLGNTIRVAFVYGSVAKQRDSAASDIDLMIIGSDLSYGEIFSALQKAEKVLSRKINPNLMSVKEWKQKLDEKRSFVSRINQQPKLFVFGNENELQRIG